VLHFSSDETFLLQFSEPEVKSHNPPIDATIGNEKAITSEETKPPLVKSSLTSLEEQTSYGFDG
jgi:hypothetical protein